MDALLERRYRIVRKHLDDLGYRQTLIIEALPLVEKLVSDLLHTTESLRYYKDLAQKSAEKCNDLELGVEPYRLDNARLVKECNELHLKLLHQEEDADKIKRELQLKIRNLESENSDLKFLSSQYASKLKALEGESTQKAHKTSHLQSSRISLTTGGKKKHFPAKKQATYEIDPPLKPVKSLQEHCHSTTIQAKDPCNVNMVELADKRICNLSQEVKCLRAERDQQAEIIATCRNQLNNRDREIQRLNSMLEGGRPLTAVRKDCCCNCKELSHQVKSLTSELKMLERNKEELEREVKVSIASQHEAMTRAVMLAECNKKLEQELHDIDQMALAVEAECNCTVKENSHRVSKIQEKLENSLMQIHNLEREVLESKRNNQELQATIEAVKNENHRLHKKLECVTEEKKRNADRINELTMIEQGLNKEIECMMQTTNIQKLKIAELECERQQSSRRIQSGIIAEKPLIEEAKKKRRSEKRTKTKSPPAPTETVSATSPSNPSSPTRTRQRRPQSRSPTQRKYPKSVGKIPNVTASEQKKSSASSRDVTKEKTKTPGSSRSGTMEGTRNPESFRDATDERTKSVGSSRDATKERTKSPRNSKPPSNVGPPVGEIPSRQPSSSEYSPKVTPKQYEELIERLQTERDFYYRECLKSKERKDSAASDNNKDIRWKLNEKEQQLAALQEVNHNLLKQIDILESRVSSVPTKDTHSTMTSPYSFSPVPGMEVGSTTSMKAVIRRLEKERDLARGDVLRLEEEREALRERLKISTETQVAEHARLEKTIIESEERVRRLEAERRELLASQGSRNATISNFENQLESTQNLLQNCQAELSEQRTLYNQIKTLQEQTDRALADSQGQLVQADIELNNARERVRTLEIDRAELDKEVATLKNEVSVLRGTLAQVDQEKDDLLISIDTKTERAAMLELELKAKEEKVLKLEESLAETRKKLSIALDDIATRDSKSRSSDRDVEKLRHELEMSERAREAAVNENRLLQNDVANMGEDLRKANHDLELSRQEVENLKIQLQDYVSEVRRVEDMLSRKEEERGEMLDHFRSLSLEASALENNNHSLETEVEEARTQLRVLNDQIVDLQQQVEARDTLVQGYEIQIAELSSNVARLETQLHEEHGQRRRTEEDLSVARDLYSKLDGQKEGLLTEVTNNDMVKIQLEAEVARLRDEQEMLQEQISRDHESIQTLENLLSTCRQDSVDQKQANEQTQKEVNSLRRKVTDLQEKLSNAQSELQRCQQQAAEYSQNVSDLQRTITNERFERAREEEARRSSVITPSYPEVTPLSPLPSSMSRHTASSPATSLSPRSPLSHASQRETPVPSAPPLSPSVSGTSTRVHSDSDDDRRYSTFVPSASRSVRKENSWTRPARSSDTTDCKKSEGRVEVIVSVSRPSRSTTETTTISTSIINSAGSESGSGSSYYIPKENTLVLQKKPSEAGVSKNRSGRKLVEKGSAFSSRTSHRSTTRKGSVVGPSAIDVSSPNLFQQASGAYSGQPTSYANSSGLVSSTAAQPTSPTVPSRVARIPSTIPQSSSVVRSSLEYIPSTIPQSTISTAASNVGFKPSTISQSIKSSDPVRSSSHSHAKRDLAAESPSVTDPSSRCEQQKCPSFYSKKSTLPSSNYKISPSSTSRPLIHVSPSSREQSLDGISGYRKPSAPYSAIGPSSTMPSSSSALGRNSSVAPIGAPSDIPLSPSTLGRSSTRHGTSNTQRRVSIAPTSGSILGRHSSIPLTPTDSIVPETYSNQGGSSARHASPSMPGPTSSVPLSPRTSERTHTLSQFSHGHSSTINSAACDPGTIYESQKRGSSILPTAPSRQTGWSSTIAQTGRSFTNTLASNVPSRSIIPGPSSSDRSSTMHSALSEKMSDVGLGHGSQSRPNNAHRGEPKSYSLQCPSHNLPEKSYSEIEECSSRSHSLSVNPSRRGTKPSPLGSSNPPAFPVTSGGPSTTQTSIPSRGKSFARPDPAYDSDDSPRPPLRSSTNEPKTHTFQLTFTSAGVTIADFDAKYTFVQQNDGKAVTNTTVSVRGANVQPSLGDIPGSQNLSFRQSKNIPESPPYQTPNGSATAFPNDRQISALNLHTTVPKESASSSQQSKQKNSRSNVQTFSGPSSSSATPYGKQSKTKVKGSSQATYK